MLDLSILKNPELAQLLQESIKFRVLPESRQKEHLSKLAQLDSQKQAEVIEFFKHANEQEKIKQREKSEKIKSLYEDMINLEATFKRDIEKDKSLKSRNNQQDQIVNTL